MSKWKSFISQSKLTFTRQRTARHYTLHTLYHPLHATHYILPGMPPTKHYILPGTLHTAYHTLYTTHGPLHTPHCYPLPATHYSLFTTTTHHSLPYVYYSLLATHFSLLTTHRSPQEIKLRFQGEKYARVQGSLAQESSDGAPLDGVLLKRDFK